MSSLPCQSDQDQQSPTAASPPGRRAAIPRNTSQASWTTEVPHHYQGTSYFPPTPGPKRTTSRSVSGARSLGARSEHDEDEHEDDVDDDGEEEEEDDTNAAVRRGKSSATTNAESPDENDEDDAELRARQITEDELMTVKDRQSLMNVDHPFGLPIWKPALYKKSRTINRDAETALHAIPSAREESHLNVGNIVWAVVFGWLLAVVCLLVSAILFVVPFGGRCYAPLIYGLGWYLFWPFGKYVAGFQEQDLDENNAYSVRASDAECNNIIQPIHEADEDIPSRNHTPPAIVPQRDVSLISSNATDTMRGINERRAFAQSGPKKSYGTISTGKRSSRVHATSRASDWFGRAVFWLLLTSIVAPLMLIICLICWFLVITIPMAKLNWELTKHMFQRPDTIRFCAAPPAVIVPSPQPSSSATQTPGEATARGPTFTLKSARLAAGQAAPSGSPSSTVLLCIYRAVGFRYYKYTVGGVNIFFVNLMAVVFFALIDGFVLLPMRDKYEAHGDHVPAILQVLANRPLVFIVSLASVIPLSYFIGMAVASISAQSSIGMGAVINATFGSIIEIILYAIALTQDKGRLVEGSIVGSVLAGVLLMPGASMCSGAVRKKEQKFNAKSAGVTSTMLIMAIIGTLTPTLFYQTYGNFELICDGCLATHDEGLVKKMPWQCSHCYYRHPDPVKDDFYQTTVKPLMYFCAAILLLSYLIGLWFSLRTHASQIWQNPQQLMHPLDFSMPPSQGRSSFYHRLTQGGLGLPTHRLNGKASDVTVQDDQGHSAVQTPGIRDYSEQNQQPINVPSGPPSPSFARRVSNAPQTPHQGGTYTPFIESVSQAMKSSAMPPMQLPENLTSEDFTRAVAVATVSALRHQQAYSHSPGRLRGSGVGVDGQEDGGGHGGHDAPSWSRTTSASVLLACTALYAAIAEILIDVVDVVLEGSGIDEKFLGLTLFALVPNTTEFMNAMSFAMYGNIALSMEIGSAYALQVCLLQIPAMVAFSVWHDPRGMGSVADTFPLIFPRWDVIAIVLSIFLLTYTYIEAKSNYHRGSILILSYLVLIAGFYFSPQNTERGDIGIDVFSIDDSSSISTLERIRISLSSLWLR
ncbi:hypothetical protein A7U60_g8731 [Sanghuangporus baumii]|uniref:Calcium permease n=1 Tax=Sanghuangporus baumii TaxID=108892 RepID=A0A9Q5MXF6_SANBA|nr:hypothetical protein A7U60_g8731 [Sanghuangporus baumii]